jgi:predicted nucleotidyltransferase
MQPEARGVSPVVEQFRALLRERLPDLRQRYGVATLSLFGSYVRGDQEPQSDLDVLVEFAETPGLFAYVELQNTLSELVGIQVDLVMKDAIKPRLARHVFEEVVAV